MRAHSFLTAVALLFVILTTNAMAQLALHYDPATGNVSFDTSNTRNGSIIGFGLDVSHKVRSGQPEFECHHSAGGSWCGHNPTNIELIPENYIPLSQSTIRELDQFRVSEYTFTTPWQGVYTLGNILPPDLDEQTWLSLFPAWALKTHTEALLDRTGSHSYTDITGAGNAPPAQFIYGPPEGEFQNRWDLVDPDTLQWAEEAQLVYRQSTGELILDTSGDSGGYTSIFQLGSNKFEPENFTPPTSSPLNSATTEYVFVAGDAFEPGQYNLGSILAPDLTFDEFSKAITFAEFTGRAGFGFDSRPVELGTDDSMPLALVFEATPFIDRCDLDGDGDCDMADIDLLSVSADGNVDQQAINQWLVAASSPDNLAKRDRSDVYTIGDLDLNGTVNSDDLVQMLNNFNKDSAITWSQGNVNGLGGVDSSDLGLLLNNIDVAQAVAVPEPSAVQMAFGLIIASLALGRRKRFAPMR